jgi:hypothetical protein
MPDIIRRLLNATVWARAGVPASAWRFRGIFRFVLPVTDLLFLWFGIVGWRNGIASVSLAAGNVWQLYWSAAIALTAFASLVGVSFPRLWAVELGARIPLVGLVAGYIALSLGRGLTDPNVTALAGLEVILILLVIWRVGDLGFVAWQHGHGGHK